MRRIFEQIRRVGDRVTGGGIRSLTRRMLGRVVSTAMSNPTLLALGRRILDPFPRLQTRIYNIANSTSDTALGQSSMPFEKGPIDMPSITLAYHHTLARDPEFNAVSYWLREGKKGTSRAQMFAALTRSPEGQSRRANPEARRIQNYDQWVATYDTIRDADRAAIRAHIDGLPYRPLISLMLTSEAARDLLWKTLDSIIRQLYPAWELCVPITRSTAVLWNEVLRHRVGSDTRIRFIRLETEMNQVDITNAAAKQATGEFVGFVRSGDILPENSLYEVVFELGTNPEANIVYSDRDDIDLSDRRSNPWFKPGWDPDLLLAEDYLNDLVIYRLELLEQIGFLRTEFQGAEFHDLALRATAATAPDRIRHIPSILYHQRVETNRTSKGVLSIDDISVAASHRAVRSQLNALGYADAAISHNPCIPGAIRVIWPVPNPQPSVSIVIPTRDRGDLLRQCLDGVLHRTNYSNFEVLIVDNGTTERATLELFEHLKAADHRIKILSRPGPFNYSLLNNAAAREATGEILLLLNNDIDVIRPDWLREMVSHAVRPDVGAVGVKLIYANRKVQHGGMVLGPNAMVSHMQRLIDMSDPGYFGQQALQRTLLAVTGACLAIRRKVFFEAGGLDSINLKIAFNDVDLCLRLGDLGYRVVWTPYAELFHLESASRGQNDSSAKRVLFEHELAYLRSTWGSLSDSTDPFHNPNLVFSWEFSEIPSAPRRSKPWHHVVKRMKELNHYFPQPN
jgi:O-antigen biosynthesis protein